MIRHPQPCIDCTHARREPVGTGLRPITQYFCVRELRTEPDPVLGTRRIVPKPLCRTEREGAAPDQCGYEGRFFSLRGADK